MAREAEDDRGITFQPVALAELVLRADTQADRDAGRRLQRDLKRIRNEETRRWSIERMFVALPISIAAMALVFALFILLLGGRFGAVGVVLAFVVTFVIVQRLDRTLAMRRIRRGFGATIVAHGFCARCAYPLKGLQPEHDGTLVCPECGAAWSATRITRPHWIAPHPALAPPPSLALRLMLLRPPVINDARGVLCRRMDSWFISMGRDRRRSLGPERVRRARSAIRRSGRFVRWPVAAVLLVAAAWVAGLMGRIGDESDFANTAAMVGLLTSVFVLALGAAATLVSELGVRTSRFTRAMSAEGLCSACASELSRPDGAGILSCPVCGTGWEAPRPDREDGQTPPAA